MLGKQTECDENQMECEMISMISMSVKEGDWVVISYDSKHYPGKVTGFGENESVRSEGNCCETNISIFLEMT